MSRLLVLALKVEVKYSFLLVFWIEHVQNYNFEFICATDNIHSFYLKTEKIWLN